jgi:hypothetical protein
MILVKDTFIDVPGVRILRTFRSRAELGEIIVILPLDCVLLIAFSRISIVDRLHVLSIEKVTETLICVDPHESLRVGLFIDKVVPKLQGSLRRAIDVRGALYEIVEKSALLPSGSFFCEK